MESKVPTSSEVQQLDFFTNYSVLEQQQAKKNVERERRMQEAILTIKAKYGKNAILKVISLEDGATARERNSSIGGHKA